MFKSQAWVLHISAFLRYAIFSKYSHLRWFDVRINVKYSIKYHAVRNVVKIWAAILEIHVRPAVLVTVDRHRKCYGKAYSDTSKNGQSTRRLKRF